MITGFRGGPVADVIAKLAAAVEGPWSQIVGIPRGGLVVAAALGYALDVRDVAAFSVRYWRRPAGPPIIGRVTCRPDLRTHDRVLVVEDATASGTLLEYARTELVLAGAQVTTAALWVSRAFAYRPDVWVEEVDVLPSGASLVVRR